MSLDQKQLDDLSKSVLTSSRIKNRIVVLCEGNVQPFFGYSPQAYRKMRTMPDANFYMKCVPNWWTLKRPQFFNCGDRKDVLDTYFTILDTHKQSPEQSYLSPDKLFALVDLDLQSQSIEQPYSFQDTEAIFYDLYKQTRVNEANALRHRIWVTGFIHKEAYFILPELQELFENTFPEYPLPMLPLPYFEQSPLHLDVLYRAMSEEIGTDADLWRHFEHACQRLRDCRSLDCRDPETLQQSWQEHFQCAVDENQKQRLIAALLLIRKAKAYWNRISPEPAANWPHDETRFREQLLLKIGTFYAAVSPDDTQCHLPDFYKTLYRFV